MIDLGGVQVALRSWAEGALSTSELFYKVGLKWDPILGGALSISITLINPTKSNTILMRSPLLQLLKNCRAQKLHGRSVRSEIFSI